MRSIVLALVAVGAIAISGMPAHAFRGWYPWCAWLSDGVDAAACAYASLQQCMKTVRGVGGACGLNPYPPPPMAPTRRGYAYK
jgi:Protein of unknown function (DUF3551)